MNTALIFAGSFGIRSQHYDFGSLCNDLIKQHNQNIYEEIIKA